MRYHGSEAESYLFKLMTVRIHYPTPKTHHPDTGITEAGSALWPSLLPVSIQKVTKPKEDFLNLQRSRHETLLYRMPECPAEGNIPISKEKTQGPRRFLHVT